MLCITNPDAACSIWGTKHLKETCSHSTLAGKITLDLHLCSYLFLMDSNTSSTPVARSINDEKPAEPTLGTLGDAAEPEKPPRDISGWKWYLTVVSILFSTFLYALDATVVADLQSVIVEEFGGIQQLSWLSVGFLLCATVTTLFLGTRLRPIRCQVALHFPCCDLRDWLRHLRRCAVDERDDSRPCHYGLRRIWSVRRLHDAYCEHYHHV